MFILLLTGFVSVSSAKNLYRNNTHKFRIIFPEGWKVERGSDPNIVVIASDITGSLINIHIAKADNNFTADMLSLEQVTGMLEGLETTFTDMELLDQSETRIDNRKALMTEFSGTFKHIKGVPRMTMLSYFTINNGYAITINCGASLALYENYKKTFVDSISTLVFEDDIIDRSPVGTTKESPVNYEDLEHFVNRIKKIHPNYQKTVNNPKFKEYINSLPDKEIKSVHKISRIEAERIYESGTAEEIIQLISNYKFQKDYQESHKSMIKKMIENYSALDRPRAINILQDWINKVEGNAKVISLSVNDSNYYHNEKSYLVIYTIARGSNKQKYKYKFNFYADVCQKVVD